MRNKITELHEDDFHKLINLQAMVLTDNQIGALPLGPWMWIEDYMVTCLLS